MERLVSAMSALSNVSLPGQLPQCLEAIAAQYGVTTVAYLGTGLRGWPERDPYLAVTYRPDWVEHYRQQNFVAIDPVIRVGLHRLLPFDWSELPSVAIGVKRVFNEARDFGLGRRGLTIPIRGRNSERALFSLTLDADERDWGRRRLRLMRDFQFLGAFTHEAIVRIERLSGPVPSLSPRERECLLWAAEGKTVWETAQILSLSQSTVRHYLETARQKLSAVSNAHAVAKALSSGLLSPLM